jgi:hypothetical protein
MIFIVVSNKCVELRRTRLKHSRLERSRELSPISSRRAMARPWICPWSWWTRGNSSNSIRIANEDNAMILTMEPTAQVTLTRTPLQPPTAEMAEVGQYDGYSDEEERVFLATEVADPDESSSDEDEGPRRQRRRVRWCLFGCECERQRGRKCNCERTGNQFCDKKCGCDPALCRARAPVESDEDNGGDD